MEEAGSVLYVAVLKERQLVLMGGILKVYY